jgi:hypothetical protein
MLCRYAIAVSARLPDAAARAFARVLAEDSGDAFALYGQGALLVLRGEEAAGLARFDRALEARPDLVDARRFRAVLLARRDAADAALRDIEICLEKEPKNGMTLYAAACVCALLSRDHKDLAGKAIDYLARAFARDYGRDKAADDTDLASLRQRQDFRDLVGR